MPSRFEIKGLIALAIVVGLVSSGALSAGEKSRLAPRATAAQTEMSFRDLPVLEQAFISAKPEDVGDGLVVGELGVDGGNKEMLVSLAQDIARNNPERIDSLLIAHKGKLVFESYFLRGRSNLPHPQASATKSYTSLALGRAMALGHLKMSDLDRPVVSFLEDLDPSRFVAGAELITLHHALTMTTGVRITQEQWEAFRDNPNQIKGQKQVQAMLEHSEPITPETQTFLYGTGPDMVMQVIDAAVPGSAKEFIERELLDKLGVTNYIWPASDSGLPRSGSRTSMTSRDMVKWGSLAANKGIWNGEQLVPAAFIDKATSGFVYTGDEDVYGGGKDVSNQCYGYYFWCADLRYGERSYSSVSAQGGGGQYIVLVDELDLVVVVTAHENDNTRLQMLAERILPAFIDHSGRGKP